LPRPWKTLERRNGSPPNSLVGAEQHRVAEHDLQALADLLLHLEGRPASRKCRYCKLSAVRDAAAMISL
jgi:hypothetical protein